MADLYILMFQEVSENGCLRLFMACGWYGALGRVANFEMRIDVPFTIPWKGCKFQKWGLRKWGYRICFFNILTCCTCCRMIIKGGGGVGGCINVLDEHFLYVTEDAHVAHAVVWSSGGVPSSSVLTADGATGFAASCDKDYPHKRFKMAEVNHKENIFTKTYYFLGRLWGKSYRTIVAGTQQMDGTWKHLKKWRPPSNAPQKIQNVYQKNTLGPTAGHGVTTLPYCRLSLLLCHKRSGTASVEKRKKLEEWMPPWYDSDDWKS